ncbi:MAG: hypothetical protein JWO68_3003 [Actinomycetia bacterium]|nr:hypothetical protein [Actinomycetes bacterium]
MKAALYVVAGWTLLSPVIALALSRSMAAPRPVPPPPPRPPVTAPPALELTDEMVAVTAHGLAASCDVVLDAGQTLRAGWADMTPEQRDDVLAMIVAQTAVVRQVLVDLTADVADDVQQALDDIERPLDGLTEARQRADGVV